MKSIGSYADRINSTGVGRECAHLQRIPHDGKKKAAFASALAAFAAGAV
jgi:hypothetical protein